MDEETLNEDMAFDRINYLLEGSRQPYDIRDMEDLENFIANKGNKRLGIYNEVRQIYNELTAETQQDIIYGD